MLDEALRECELRRIDVPVIDRAGTMLLKEQSQLDFSVQDL